MMMMKEAPTPNSSNKARKRQRNMHGPSLARTETNLKCPFPHAKTLSPMCPSQCRCKDRRKPPNRNHNIQSLNTGREPVRMPTVPRQTHPSSSTPMPVIPPRRLTHPRRQNPTPQHPRPSPPCPQRSPTTSRGRRGRRRRPWRSHRPYHAPSLQTRPAPD